MSVDSVDEEKQQLRRTARDARKTWAGGAGEQAAVRLAENFSKIAADFPSGSVLGSVAGYWPMADEMDVRPLLTRLAEEGREIALPVVVAKDAPLIFRRWRPGLVLEDGDFGTRHPGPDEPEVTPAIVLVPLLAFDAQGYRLGWGGGFYDRTLARLRASGPVVAVGVAYQSQLVDSVPRTATDEALDWMVTDSGVLEIPREIKNR